MTDLTPKAPTVTLTRLQSGVGVLQVEAACGEAVGDVRIGCAYQLTSGVTSVVQRTSGVSLAPPGSTRPVVVARRGQFEELLVDLAQVRDLERLVVYLYSESDAALRWGGTLVVTTFGQAEIRLALDRAQSTGVMVAMSVYNIGGELVLRREDAEVEASIREACVAFGFDRISWLDSRTPLV